MVAFAALTHALRSAPAGMLQLLATLAPASAWLGTHPDELRAYGVVHLVRVALRQMSRLLSYPQGGAAR